MDTNSGKQILQYDYQKLGKFVKELRQSKNITTTKLTELSGLSLGIINLIENNKLRSVIKYSTLEKLANALDIPVDKLEEFTGRESFQSDKMTTFFNDENNKSKFEDYHKIFYAFLCKQNDYKDKCNYSDNQAYSENPQFLTGFYKFLTEATSWKSRVLSGLIEAEFKQENIEKIMEYISLIQTQQEIDSGKWQKAL